MHRLQRLVLSSNHISAIAPIADTSSSSVRSLKHLALASNALRSWADIDHISDWCPELESLTLTENPLVEGDRPTSHCAMPITDHRRDGHDTICQTQNKVRMRDNSSLHESQVW